MIRLLLAVLLCAGAFTDASAQAPAELERIRRVENGLLQPVTIRGVDGRASIAARMATLDVPGVSIAVIDDGRIAWARGYGVRELGSSEPVDTATLFQAASISKPVAAVAALRLVEEGRLELDGDVNARLRSWQVPQNGFTSRAPVTLARLLSHSAGLTVHGFRGYAQGEAVPALVQVLNGERPANSAAVRADTLPGSLWRYSGGGSTVAQLLMQDVTGRPFPELMQAYVLEPAAMVHSTYEQPLPPARAAFAATGHRGDGRPVTGRWHTYPEMFAAGLWTTPSDLARLAIAIQHSVRGEGDLLSQAMTRTMLTRYAGEYGFGFGLPAGDGWSAFSHGGANEGFRAMLFAFADRGQGAVIMTNSDNGAVLAAEILRSIAAEYEWPAYRPVERSVIAIPEATLAQLAGTYEIDVNGRTQRLVIELRDGALHTAGPPLAPPGASRVLHASAPDTFFYVQNPTAVLRFERDAAGLVTHLFIEGVGSPGPRLTRSR